jgi:hypothetical protein
MWRHYFGPAARITGIDIEPACRAYASGDIHVAIGDQADRQFWRRFRGESPPLDIVIDDGGHRPEQQLVTLEETLPHLRPGGVYVCEDVHGTGNRFAAFAHTLADQLNAKNWATTAAGELACDTTSFQTAIGSIHCYPFVVVIELAAAPAGQLIAPKHGTQWQPFL